MKAYFLNLEIFAVKKMSAMSFFTFLLHRIRILTNANREEKLSTWNRKGKQVTEYSAESKDKPLETSITANETQ